jgi:hypothetical protein
MVQPLQEPGLYVLQSQGTGQMCLHLLLLLLHCRRTCYLCGLQEQQTCYQLLAMQLLLSRCQRSLFLLLRQPAGLAAAADHQIEALCAHLLLVLPILQARCLAWVVAWVSAAVGCQMYCTARCCYTA